MVVVILMMLLGAGMAGAGVYLRKTTDSEATVWLLIGLGGFLILAAADAVI